MRQHCRKPTYWNSLESQPVKIYKSGKKRTDRTKTHINRTFTVTQNRFWFYIFSNAVSHNTKLRDIAVWESWKQGRNRMFLRLIFVFSEKFIEKPPVKFYGERRYLSKNTAKSEQIRWFFVIATMLPTHKQQVSKKSRIHGNLQHKAFRVAVCGVLQAFPPQKSKENNAYERRIFVFAKRRAKESIAGFCKIVPFGYKNNENTK